MPVPDSLENGSPDRLGAHWDGSGVNFAVAAPSAEAVELCLFDDPDDRRERVRLTLPERVGHVWHGYAPGVAPGQIYGYRVHGPYQPRRGHRFNPNKLLFDPYARAVGRPLRWSDPLFGYPADSGVPESPEATNELDPRDSAPFAPLGAVLDHDFEWGDDASPRRVLAESLIYEIHVKGFTKLHPGVPEHLRGTYAGLACPAAVDHLLKLGVTAVELLPIHHHVDEARLEQLGLTNYWGYSTLGFFAPEPFYAADPTPGGCVREFKSMVKLLHAAGIEVLLDVVYNHTCEGNEKGPTLSLRGFGNAAYYRLDPLDRSHFVNYSGTGNTVDTRNPLALRLILDSLRYWVEEMHVDGFRFDLCTALCRESDAFDRGAGFLDAVHQDPVLSRVKLIAEPWDIGPRGYQVGAYPTRWSEWNGRYRDDMRRFWKGDPVTPGVFANRFAGSSDLYNHDGRGPTASINLISAHDGFTLNDLVTYERKHNLANGEFNRDGDSHNNSANYGVEGPTNDIEIRAVRERQMRNMLATLMLSAGVPHLLGGDEIARTQLGNNNAYCQDNEMSWFDWELARHQQRQLAFVRRLVSIRREQPALRRRRFYTGRPPEGMELPDIDWRTPVGEPMNGDAWRDPAKRSLAVWIGADPRGGDALFFMVNAHKAAVTFRLPEEAARENWERLFDTFLADGGETEPVDGHYLVQGRSCVLLRVAPGEDQGA